MPLGKKSQVTKGTRAPFRGRFGVFTRMSLVAILPALAWGFVFIFGTAYVSQSAEAAKYAVSENSQTIGLLESVPNPDGPILARGGGDITIVEGVALLPESGPAGTLADIEGATHGGRISLYGVREGDTLSQIADMFGVSVNTIRWANDIGSKESIQPGDTLVILPITGLSYTIKKGGTVEDVAELLGADAQEIALFNGISLSEPLAAGTEIIVPGGEIAAPTSDSTPAPSAPTSVPTPSAPSYAGYYMRPIAGGIVSQGLHGYNAVDLATHYGAEIYAAASGQVIVSRNSGWNGGYGNYIVITHDNGTETLYAHTSQNIVSVGQRVVQGQVIGYVGTTGHSTGPHVHFEVRGATNPFQ